MPSFIPPMLATLVAAPFDDPDWQFEVKWDGFRVEALVDGETVHLRTRLRTGSVPEDTGPTREIHPAALTVREWLERRRAIPGQG
jgi:hypothetical protein